MKRSQARTVVALNALSFVCLGAGCRSVLELEPELRTTIRVGDTAAMRVDTARRFSVGWGGELLRLIKRIEEHGTTAYVYRAVAPGDHTFVLTPRETGPDSCVSCVTVHYFVTVVQ
jgi:hypothetical protein